jgi:hypothetical protein
MESSIMERGAIVLVKSEFQIEGFQSVEEIWQVVIPHVAIIKKKVI